MQGESGFGVSRLNLPSIIVLYTGIWLDWGHARQLTQCPLQSVALTLIVPRQGTVFVPSDFAEIIGPSPTTAAGSARKIPSLSANGAVTGWNRTLSPKSDIGLTADVENDLPATEQTFNAKPAKNVDRRQGKTHYLNER